MNEHDMQFMLTPPDNWQWGEFQNKNNQHIRYGWNRPKNAWALIIFAEGRTEVIEEYFENIRYFNDLGYACAIMDWQGQGLSYRLTGDNSRHHSIGFEQDISDFKAFLSQLDIKLPQILIAHSMGGNITLRYLLNHHDIFKCAIMVAPMLGLNPKRIIKHLGNVILSTAGKLGAMEKHAFGQTAWNEHIANIAKYKVSSDPVRRDLQPYLFKTRPELQSGGVTFGWLAVALKSIHILHDAQTLTSIQTPLFFATAANDIVVNNEGTMITLKHLPHAEHKSYEHAEHQIHREKDEIRLRLLKDIDTFIKKHL
jgi:lysophospholipase